MGWYIEDGKEYRDKIQPLQEANAFAGTAAAWVGCVFVPFCLEGNLNSIRAKILMAYALVVFYSLYLVFFPLGFVIMPPYRLAKDYWDRWRSRALKR